jgi:hypothetical protein
MFLFYAHQAIEKSQLKILRPASSIKRSGYENQGKVIHDTQEIWGWQN